MTPALPALGATMLLLVAGCDKGDWFPLERTARELFNGWDMWDTPAKSAHQMPRPPVVDGAVPVGGVSGYAEARVLFDRLAPSKRQERAALAYRRYCHHCHGPNGDGRIIVGESFGSALPDLRSAKIQQQDDQDIYDTVMDGGGNRLSLRGTITPLEALLAISHLRTLSDAPSRPFYAPKDTVPLR